MNTGEQPTLQELADRANRLLGIMNGGSNAVNITVQAGPVASWLAAGISLCGAAFVAGALLVGAAWYAEQSQQMRDEIADLRQRDRVHDAYINSSFRDREKTTEDKRSGR